MIDEHQAHRYCRDDISLIENYDKAKADTTQTWHCHHRDEIRVLPSGMKVYRSVQELIENGRYYSCPANELIFLTKSEHHRIHHKYMTEESRKKMSESHKGTHHTAETKKRISDSHKGVNNPMYGKTLSAAALKKISASMKAAWARRRKEN